jgi:glycosyltransferase involved in cell wall biosynthesis
MNPPSYSIVIPVYNEQEALPLLRERLVDLLGRLDGESEVILVNDGSTDASYAVMLAFYHADPRFKVVNLSRNFGHQLAITAGTDLACGDAVVIMDADLQDPPEVVLEMAAKWREGYEVVYGVRTDRPDDSLFKRSTARLYYRFLQRLADTNMPFDVGDFRLIDRRAVEAFKEFREQSRYVRGLFSWIGFRQIGVPYRRADRSAGTTKYPLRKMIHLALDGMAGFSRTPLRLALKAGLLCATGAFAYGLYTLISKLIGGDAVPGYASIVTAIFFLGGIQLAVLGAIGEYIGRIHQEVLRRPLYIVSNLHGLGLGIGSPPRAVIAEPRSVVSLLGDSPTTEVRLHAG